MRSFAEIAFRLRQELTNFIYFLRPPRCTRLHPTALPLPSFPPVLSEPGFPSPPVAWRRDPVTGVEAPLQYFRLIPYLDPLRAGDHKRIWDGNRHQDLAVLSARGEHRLVFDLLEDWMDANPVHRGMNWTSALEVSFRALSWLYIWHSPGRLLPRRFLDFLYAHAAHLDANLSIYFSPNTHLLGEAVALHALGLFFAQPAWTEKGRHWVLTCLRHQVLPDGAYFEQSSYYHLYALEFFHFHHCLEALPPEDFSTVHRMGLFLRALLGQQDELPLLGDDDGGRLYHPFAPYSAAARQALHRLWPQELPPLDSLPQVFPNTGLVFVANGPVQILFDAGPFARLSAGHSHSDTLSVLARRPEAEILIDPGTFTYVADPAARELFRSCAMHNTIRLAGRDHAIPAGPFRWNDKPTVRLLEASPLHAAAELRYQDFLHQRTLRWDPHQEILDIEDFLSGPPGPHSVEQFWHFASSAAASRLRAPSTPGFSLQARPELSFRSRRFAEREPSYALCYSGSAPLPLVLHTRLLLSPDAKIPS
jgi:hypothetical protein